jgi:hypothetical protein
MADRPVEQLYALQRPSSSTHPAGCYSHLRGSLIHVGIVCFVGDSQLLSTILHCQQYNFDDTNCDLFLSNRSRPLERV